MTLLMAIIGALVSIVGVTLLRGWAIATLWCWFVVSTFHVPALSIPAAIGIAVLVGMFTSKVTESNKTPSKMDIASVLLNPVISVAAGWVIKQYM